MKQKNPAPTGLHHGSLFCLLLCCSVFIFIAAALNCLIWFLICQHTDTEAAFRNSETLQLLQIIIGFTYISVIRSFFDAFAERTSLVAEIRTLHDSANKIPIEFYHKLIGKESTITTNTDSWKYWEQKGVAEEWKQVFNKVIVQSERDTGDLFNLFGPCTALFIYYVVHPPVAYSDDGDHWAWGLIYCFSVTILFSFLLAMWIILTPMFNKCKWCCAICEKCRMDQYMELTTRHVAAEPVSPPPRQSESLSTVNSGLPDLAKPLMSLHRRTSRARTWNLDL